MFGGGPNQCSTSNLCPQGQFCCNDGCKNVCQWTPEVEAKLAQEEARAKQHQQMIIQVLYFLLFIIRKSCLTEVGKKESERRTSCIYCVRAGKTGAYSEDRLALYKCQR